tara:strand:- start:411 stop:1007 length:597 start_codon:yes stop_codon:yes gene_type:complete
MLKNLRSIKNWKKRNFNSPSPEFIKHQIIRNNNLENSVWIETGTYYGETTKLLSRISNKTVTIEADEFLYKNTKDRMESYKNVEFLNGKSEDLLLSSIQSNLNFKNICIYLDAHLCSDHLRNKNTFGNENNATPIKLELEIIEKFLSNFEKVNILIDDIRLFDKNFQNYPNKSGLVEWCVKNKLSWEIEHDIFICKKF